MDHELVILPEPLTFRRETHSPNGDSNLTNQKSSQGQKIKGLLNNIGEVIDATQSHNIKQETQNKNSYGYQHLMALVEFQKAVFVFDNVLNQLMAFEKSLGFDGGLTARTSGRDGLTVVRILNVTTSEDTWDICFWTVLRL